MSQNKKQKVKRSKSRVKAKKQKRSMPAKKNKKTLGRRIAVKVVKEPKNENVYGAIAETEAANNQAITEPTIAFPDFDFTENETENNEADNLEAVEIEESASQPEVLESEEINDAPAAISQEDFPEDEADPFNSLSPFQKNLIMYISISCIMLVVVGFWVVGLKASLGQNFQSTTADDASLAEIQQSFQDITNNVGKLKNQWEAQQKALEDFSSQAKQKILEEKMKNSITEQMKAKIANPQAPATNLNTNANINSINTNSQ